MSSTVQIVQEYQNYTPPVVVYRSVQLLLRYVPQQHLVGLHKITLTNSENLKSRRKAKITSEKRRIRPSDCRGLYGKGYILLLIDRIFQDYPEIFLLVSPFKTFLIGEVLYHEIGHHIHRIEEPGYRDNKEAVADEWKERLLQNFLRQRYWYLTGVRRLLSRLLRPVATKLKCALEEEEV